MSDESMIHDQAGSDETTRQPERDNMGRFVKGCKPGPGRRRVPRSAQYRQAYENGITPEDLERLVRNTLHRAMNGDHRARAWIGQYYFQDKNRKPPPIAIDEGNQPAFTKRTASY